MALAKVAVKIKGISPLLMHRWPLVPIEALEKKPPEEQARLAAYVMEDGTLYIPGPAIQRALVGGAAFSKGKGRATLAKVAAACILISPDQASLGRKVYAVDSRPVVIPATKGRVVRHRPRLDQWEASFDLEYDPDLLTEEQVRRIVDDTGSRVGILEFRPERKGPFGRFMVAQWDA